MDHAREHRRPDAGLFETEVLLVTSVPLSVRVWRSCKVKVFRKTRVTVLYRDDDRKKVEMAGSAQFGGDWACIGDPGIVEGPEPLTEQHFLLLGENTLLVILRCNLPEDSGSRIWGDVILRMRAVSPIIAPFYAPYPQEEKCVFYICWASQEVIFLCLLHGCVVEILRESPCIYTIRA